MNFTVAALSLSMIFIACNNNQQGKEGLAIAKKKCSSCHEFVEASLLDRDTWITSVIPEMAQRAQLTADERAKVIEYYSLMSPAVLPRAKAPEKIIRDNWQFEPLIPRQKSVPTSTTTLVAFDSLSGLIYTGDMLKGSIYRWNKNLEPVDTTSVPSGASNAIFLNENNKRHVVFTAFGDIMPYESSVGRVIKYNIDNQHPQLEDTIASMLPRPVYSAAADFNNDGLTDYLTCGFGHEKGGLYISWQQQENKYKTATIIATAGSAQIHIEDFNHDGWKDFMVLFSNAEESVRLFMNNMDGSFTMKKLLSFLPVAGSTSFQVIDMNKDGLPDIIYTSGDNSDLSKVFKPFHGLYIYINQGNFNYKQEYFFPVNGCTKAIATDLDNDGDLDIATIAFFADFNSNSAEKCILFEQDKPLHFIPHSPAIDTLGRWICMEVADYDNDGDPDILLGSFSWGFLNFPLINNRWSRNYSFTVLKNMRKNASPK